MECIIVRIQTVKCSGAPKLTTFLNNQLQSNFQKDTGSGQVQPHQGDMDDPDIELNEYDLKEKAAVLDRYTPELINDYVSCFCERVAEDPNFPKQIALNLYAQDGSLNAVQAILCNPNLTVEDVKAYYDQLGLTPHDVVYHLQRLSIANDCIIQDKLLCLNKHYNYFTIDLVL